jgi:hypothetical protein
LLIDGTPGDVADEKARGLAQMAGSHLHLTRCSPNAEDSRAVHARINARMKFRMCRQPLQVGHARFARVQQPCDPLGECPSSR